MRDSMTRLGLNAIYSRNHNDVNTFLSEIQAASDLIPVHTEAKDGTPLTLPVRLAVFMLNRGVKRSIPTIIKKCAQIFLYEQDQPTCRYRERIFERIEFLESKIAAYDSTVEKKKKLDKTFEPRSDPYWNSEIFPAICDHSDLCAVLRIYRP